MRMQGIATVLSLALATPLAAQTLQIDDDGYEFVTEEPSTGQPIEINDDGWEYVPGPDVEGLNATIGTRGECSTLENSAGVTGSDCGTMSREEIINKLDG